MINEDELFEHIEDLQWELDFCRKELDYYCSFLSWKKLWDEFEYFQRNSHLEYPDEVSGKTHVPMRAGLKNVKLSGEW